MFNFFLNYYNMEKFVKYKDSIYFHCFGPNDDNFASNKARYSSNGISNNAKDSTQSELTQSRHAGTQ